MNGQQKMTEKTKFDILFGKRVRELAKNVGGIKSLADISGVNERTLNRWVASGFPKLDQLVSMAWALGVTTDVLATGREKPSGNDDLDEKFILIPRYDAVLAAGAGAFNERAQMLDEIPFTREFLKKRMGRSNTKGLVMLNISGDSMDPTIADGDLVMVDRKNKKIADGVFAFVDDGDARVKRFRRTIGGGFDVISDNKEAYPPEHLSQNDMDHIDIIGRVCWIGRSY